MMMMVCLAVVGCMLFLVELILVVNFFFPVWLMQGF